MQTEQRTDNAYLGEVLAEQAQVERELKRHVPSSTPAYDDMDTPAASAKSARARHLAAPREASPPGADGDRHGQRAGPGDGVGSKLFADAAERTTALGQRNARGRDSECVPISAIAGAWRFREPVFRLTAGLTVIKPKHRRVPGKAVELLPEPAYCETFAVERQDSTATVLSRRRGSRGAGRSRRRAEYKC